jgi:hypothetical protein
LRSSALTGRRLWSRNASIRSTCSR